jgi:ribonuclease BN (tRNA processing enzyme)
MPTSIHFLGTGDTFGSGGRFNTSFYVSSPPARFLLDCGATTPVAMKRGGVPLADVDGVLLSHFHGDHFAGVPFLLVEGLVTRRSRPLWIAGPPAVAERTRQITEALFPGFSLDQLPFPLQFIPIPAWQPTAVGNLEVTLFPVVHTPQTQPHAVRIQLANTRLAFSGDTEWTDVLPDVCRDTDLFLCECYAFEGPVHNHIDYGTLQGHLGELHTKRLMLTHLGPEMLANQRRVTIECAGDGQKIEF